MIELKNISYSYSHDGSNGDIAVDDINLKIDKNEFIGIAGHTGSGKTTVAQILAGLIQPTNGQICVDGEVFTDYKFAARKLRSKVGIVFQYPEHQLFEETVYRDIAFGPKNKGLSEAEVDECVRRSAELAHLPEKLFNKSPFELSGGQKRRVAIAGVLATEPEILILDEPAAGLDPDGRKRLLNRLRSIHEKSGKTIILISHSMEDIAEFTKRTVVLSGGKKIADDAPESIFSDSRILEKSGLDMPEIAKIMNLLKKGGMDIDEHIFTVEDALREIKEKLGVE